MSLKHAAEYLSNFLEAAESNPKYHPSHHLTPQGIKFPQSAQNTSGADKLRVLGFIARGMSGEVVEEAKEVLAEMDEKIKAERAENEFARKRKVGEDSGDQQGKKFKENEAADEDQTVREKSQATPRMMDDAQLNGQPVNPEETEGPLTEQMRQQRKEAKKAKRKEEKRERAQKGKEKASG
jgi:hypothetical protein